MALTPHQRAICRLIAANRIARGEAYLAGGVALNELLGSTRVSRDIDLFHDTEEAVAATWAADRGLLEADGFEVVALRERPSFVEAQVRRSGESVLVQWARESAFRFFPLVEHPELGLTLHPFDLATNKVLALVGRLEVRDWIDVIECDRRLQPLGYLAWAACGKDPGFGPASILAEAARTSRYSREEIQALAFEGTPPDADALARHWHTMLNLAHEIIAELPAEQAGTCVLARDGTLYAGTPSTLETALADAELVFHRGSIRGALPQLRV
jgi:hypothetical protein